MNSRDHEDTMANLANFRKQYPHCTLTSEFVLAEHGQFLVRCGVEQQGREVASGLSAATTIEAAEDQARDRALMLLSQIGVPPLFPTSVVAESTGQPSLSPSPISESAIATSPPSIPPSQSVKPERPEENPTPPVSEPEPVELVERGQSIESVSPLEPIEPPPMPAAVDVELTTDPPAPIVPIEDEVAIAPPPEVATVPPTPSPTPQPPTQPSTPPPTRPDGSIDCIELIARTNREIQRLGWTSEQGQTYLIQTYGKRSRSRLDDHELIEFLQYLEAQP